MTITVDYCRWKYLTMTLPAGASPSNVVCLYQFNKHTEGLLDRSGNGHNLTNKATFEDYYSLTEQSMGVSGLEFRSDYFVYGPTGLSPSTLGALTLEFIWTPTLYTDQDDFIFMVAGPSASEAAEDNIAVSFWLDRLADRGQLYALHEYGGGTNEIARFDWVGCQSAPQYVALTRAADGVTYKLYINGEHVATTVAANAPTGSSSSAVNIRMGGDSGGNDLYAYMHSLRYTKELYSDNQIMESYLACRDPSCGLGSATETVRVENVFVVAQDVIRVDFTNPIAITNSVLDPDSYILSPGLEVDEVLTVESRTAQSLFIKVTPKAQFDTEYQLLIPSAGTSDLVVEIPDGTFYTPTGVPLQTMTASWAHHRTKVDSVLASLANMYDIKLGSNLRMILQAIMISDEEIGGDF